MPPRLIDRIPNWVKALLVVAALYLFLVGIGAMSAAFKMMGKGYTKELLASPGGPVVSLFIGILATTLVQSSSTTTSIIVGLVAAGAVPLSSAVFMVMGANVGTTVTNTIVSLGHITRSNEYRRAFAAATVHDFFNLIVLVVLFPIEILTGGLTWLADQAVTVFKGIGVAKLGDPIKAVTKPTIHALQDLVEAIGGGGVLLLILALCLTFIALIWLVKLLRSIMVAKLENLFDRVIFKSAGRGFLFGLLLTCLVQSSSITTSLAVPLVGAGILTVRQILPYTMGANIGTTITALIAALAALGEPTGLLGLELALFHLSFNLIGTIMLWPIRWLPTWIAESFAALAMKNRAIPIFYIVIVFYVTPFLVIWFGR